MPKTVVDGYLVQKRYERDGHKLEPENLGVAFNEYDARELIERESGFYGEQPFEYGRSKLEDGIIYVKHNENERIRYTITKCLVLYGG